MLAKSIRKCEEKRVRSLCLYLLSSQIQIAYPLSLIAILIRALRCVEQLKHVLSIQSSPHLPTPKAGSNIISSTVGESRSLTSELASIIQETNDAERLEKLLNVNDQLLNLLKKVPGPGKPILTLQSLVVAFKNSFFCSDGKLNVTPHINGRPSDRGEDSSEGNSLEDFEDSPTTLNKGKT